MDISTIKTLQSEKSCEQNTSSMHDESGDEDTGNNNSDFLIFIPDEIEMPNKSIKLQNAHQNKKVSIY